MTFYIIHSLLLLAHQLANTKWNFPHLLGTQRGPLRILVIRKIWNKSERKKCFLQVENFNPGKMYLTYFKDYPELYVLEGI